MAEQSSPDTPRTGPTRSTAVFNPGAIRLQDTREILLLARVEDRRGISHLCGRSLARRQNELENRSGVPTLLARSEDRPEEIWGVEDPRIVWAPEIEQIHRYLHRILPRRPGRCSRSDRGFQNLRSLRNGHAAGRQGCGPFPAPVRRPLGDDPPAGAGIGIGAHVDFVFSGFAALGQPQGADGRRAKARGGTRARSG